MKIEINCTRETLERAKYCGTSKKDDGIKISENCWVAIAVRDLFPEATVGVNLMYLFPVMPGEDNSVSLPNNVIDIISCFDSFAGRNSDPDHVAKERLETLKPFSFEIELNEYHVNRLLESISLDEVHEILDKSLSLNLVEL